MRKVKQIKVSSAFDQEIRNIHRLINEYMQKNNIPQRISIRQTADLLLVENDLVIKPEEIIKTGRKGKRLKFRGEIRL